MSTSKARQAELTAEPAGLSVEDAIRGRQSIRAYLETPVPRPLIARILETAGRAPSGSNIQPWKAWVVDGAPLKALCAEILALYDTSGEGTREYNYYPVNWREPFLGRRRGWIGGRSGRQGREPGDLRRVRQGGPTGQGSRGRQGKRQGGAIRSLRHRPQRSLGFDWHRP